MSNLTTTPSQTVGPYLHLGLTDHGSIACVAGKECGEPLRLTFRVLDGQGVPVPDAMIEVWQADARGNYPRQSHGASSSSFKGFGRLATGEDGSCTFETIRPGRVPGREHSLQAPHINVSVLGRGILKRLSTRVYFAGESANSEDPVLRLVPEARRETLFAQRDSSRADSWIFEVRLQGEKETVFFDV